MNKSLIILLPKDVWICISEFLNNMDKLRLFWFLWKEQVLKFDSVVSAFHEMSFGLE